MIHSGYLAGARQVEKYSWCDLIKWIVDGKVYWPVGISALRAIELDKDPEKSWKPFPHVDNFKLTGRTYATKEL